MEHARDNADGPGGKPSVIRKIPLSAPARPGSGPLAALVPRGLSPGHHRGQANLSVHRLLHLPLVPRDGPGDLPGPGSGPDVKPGLRLREGGPGGAAGRGRGLYGGLPAAHRLRGLAADHSDDAGSETLLGGDLSAPQGPGGRPGAGGAAGRGGAAVAVRPGAAAGAGMPGGRAGGPAGAGPRRRAGPSPAAGGRRPAAPPLRPGERGIWRCAQVPLPLSAALSAGAGPAGGGPGGLGDGGGHPAADGQGRHL